MDMKPQAESSTPEVLAGLVERVTYHNVENGFCVLRAKARGHRDVVTVVGHAATISAGEWITASGEWVNDRTHGQQFKARFLRTSPPTSADGIEKYLSSGMIRGVGPVYAKKLVRAFGEKVFEVIETTPDRLREVDGIEPVRAASILAAWAEQKAVREIMIFLHSHGVGTARAVRIFKTYGSDAIQVMSENPYRLARDIRGIGFKTADAIAMKLGIEKTAMIRVRAGISYALTEAMDEGHCGLPTDETIPIGSYGTSNIGHAKSVYRMGLGHRYGRRMQTISGIHYNWSLPGVTSEEYFALIRNFRRHAFLLLYLWPFLEARFTRDRAEHHLLDRPSERPVRTALGMTVLTFYTVLFAAGAQDVFAQELDVSIKPVLLTFRILCETQCRSANGTLCFGCRQWPAPKRQPRPPRVHRRPPNRLSRSTWCRRSSL